MKKSNLLSIFLCIAVVLSTIPIAYASDGEEIGDKILIGIMGDSNMDGSINVKDATEIQRYNADLLDFNDDQKILANVDGNKITITDATWIQKYVADYDCSGCLVGQYAYREPDVTPTEPVATEDTPTTVPEQTVPTTEQPETTVPPQTDDTKPTEPTTTEPQSTTVTEPSEPVTTQPSQTEPTTTIPVTVPSESTAPTDVTKTLSIAYYVTAPEKKASSLEGILYYDKTQLALKSISYPAITDANAEKGSFVENREHRNGVAFNYTCDSEVLDFTNGAYLVKAEFEILDENYVTPRVEIPVISSIDLLWEDDSLDYVGILQIN